MSISLGYVYVLCFESRENENTNFLLELSLTLYLVQEMRKDIKKSPKTLLFFLFSSRFFFTSFHKKINTDRSDTLHLAVYAK